MDVEANIREYLPDVIHMSLATSADNRPWVCEVHYAYDDELNLYWRSLTSRRHSQEIAANPHIAGNIVRQFGVGEVPSGVYFEGTARLLEAGPDQQQAYEAITARLGLGPEILEQAADPAGHQFYRVAVSDWYVFGVFGTPRGEKYHLSWPQSS
jgi:uncharacterized protein YhbP (UPF0306 family)